MKLNERETILDLLDRSVAFGPTHAALALHDSNLSYAELNNHIKRVAASVTALPPTEIVALYFPMSPEFVISFFGVSYANKAVLPLNLLLPPEELQAILKDSGAGCIITSAELALKLKPLGLPVHSYTDLLGKRVLPGHAPRPHPDDLCALLYTSGTTGKPKGVMLTHYNLASNASSAVEALRITYTNRFLACLPTFHSLAITGTMLAPLAAGASLATLPKFDPDAVLAIASGLQCDVLLMAPSMYRVIARMQERHPREMSHLRLAVSGSEPLSEEIRTQFKSVFNIELLDGYGQTESSPVISINLPEAHKPGTVGKPIPGVQVRIVDPDSLKDMPTDQTGEIWAHGPNIMKGYRNRPEENAAALTKDGWLRTGDMGALDAEGYLRITGRIREMIKIHGEMVFAAEVEHALATHAAVAEVAVVGAKNERGEEAIKAYVVLKPGAQATPDALIEHARAALPAFKVPSSVEIKPDLPKGPTGKIMKRLIK